VTEPRGAHQCGNEQWFGPDSSSFSAQMRFEPRSVGCFPSKHLGALLVAPLPVGRFDYSHQESIFDRESRCELVRQTERCRHNSRAKDAVEDAVPTRKVTIFKPPNDLGTRKAERSCAVENKSSDGVGVLAVSRLDRRSP
jgi:hypothetical protein